MIAAFGVAKFGGERRSKSPTAIIEEVNSQLKALGKTGDDVVNIHIDDEFFHVFYRNAE